MLKINKNALENILENNQKQVRGLSNFRFVFYVVNHSNNKIIEIYWIFHLEY